MYLLTFNLLLQYVEIIYMINPSQHNIESKTFNQSDYMDGQCQSLTSWKYKTVNKHDTIKNHTFNEDFYILRLVTDLVMSLSFMGNMNE